MTVAPRILISIGMIAFVGGCGSSAELIRPDPPENIVESLELFHDDSRNRVVPVKIYSPRTSTGRLPVIVFSHGLGSSRQGYVYLGRAWAARGYVSIHVQHVASDSEVLRRKGMLAIYRAAYDAVEYRDRPADVSFVIDVLEKRARSSVEDSIWSRLDLSRIGAAGHSYGAQTALTLGGMLVNFPDAEGISELDARVKAAVLLSAPTMDWSPTEREFAPIRIPTMHISGTLDSSRLWRTNLQHRRRAFDSIRGAPRYFLNIDGATHQTFADLESMRIAKKNGRLDVDEPPLMQVRTAEHQRRIDLITSYSVAFWDAYLKGSSASQQWLESNKIDDAVLEASE